MDTMNQIGDRMPMFALGQLVATPAALSLLEACGKQPFHYLAKHVSGDWGDTCAEDCKTNEQALQSGARIMSAYTLPDGEKIWIITEADRSSTTILMPSEY